MYGEVCFVDSLTQQSWLKRIRFFSSALGSARGLSRGTVHKAFKLVEDEVCTEKQANRNLKLSNHWPADPKFNALHLIQTERGLRGVYSYVRRGMCYGLTAYMVRCSRVS